jgi:hypothetical protein
MTGRGGLYVCEMSRLPHFLDNRLTDGGEVVSLTRGPRFTLQKQFLVLISVAGGINPRAIVGLEGLGKSKKKNSMTSSGIEPCDLPACSTVPQRYRRMIG